MRKSSKSSKSSTRSTKATSSESRSTAIDPSGTSSAGRVDLGAPSTEFNGVKVFSATMVADREQLGDKITAWIQANPQCEVREAVVTQSSDEAFHCIAITLFYWEDLDR